MSILVALYSALITFSYLLIDVDNTTIGEILNTQIGNAASETTAAVVNWNTTVRQEEMFNNVTQRKQLLNRSNTSLLINTPRGRHVNPVVYEMTGGESNPSHHGYHWYVQGYSPCSKSCLGGKRKCPPGTRLITSF